MLALKGISLGLVLLGLGACGEHDHSSQDTDSNADNSGTESADTTDHSGHQSAASNASETMREDDDSAERFGHATGSIRSVDSDDGFLMIQHGPFSGGIDMGAMTMGFDIMGDVDPSSFSEGDNVAFRVKQGFDGGLRIMQICNTDTEGEDCLQD